MPSWSQTYDPLQNLATSSLIAGLPILLFFTTLALLRWKGHVAATLTVATALAIAILFYGMPVEMAIAAAADGFLFGLWPIAWIIIAAVFLYKLTVKSGQFEIIRASVTSVTEDQRLQMLMIGFSFGAFLEGAAGFGTPVAITAAMLVGLGFNPLYAAGLCLIANTAPVAFGALGTPIIVAGQVSGLDPFLVGAMAGRQLPFLSLFVPFWIIGVMDGWRGIRETWPAILVAGGSFALSQFLVSNFIGPELPDIISSLASLTSVTLFLKVWSPKNVFRFDGNVGAAARTHHGYSTATIFKAWSPFLLLTVIVTIWSLPAFKTLFAKNGALAGINYNIPVAFLDKLVVKTAPIVTNPTPYGAVYNFSPLAASGTAILITAILAGLFLKLSPATLLKSFGETLWDLRWPVYTIGMVLSFAYIANYSGASSSRTPASGRRPPRR